MESKEKLAHRIQVFNKALISLQKSTELPVNNQRDQAGIVKNFEFTYEMSWKALKLYIEYLGAEAPSSPRGILKKSFSMKIIMDEETWLSMIEDRNKTTHTYDEESALKIIDKIKNKYVDAFNRLQQSFTENE